MAKSVDLNREGGGESGSRKTFSLKDTLPFGKYKGDTVQRVLGKDPKYLLWCQSKIEWFNLSEEAMEMAEIAADPEQDDTYDRFKRWDKG